MEFKSQICTTREQSERLLALGLKPETADMHHYRWSEGFWRVEACPLRGDYPSLRDFPAWSLHRLISMLDNEFHEYTVQLEDTYNDIVCDIEDAIRRGRLPKKYLALKG